ncbi:hypothetical protein E3N88_10867 [Mikania micrantha]|uniref:Uncharacterized protein n=1 Tax=Mikania micrantha TaxID=192012 RepID=A0A5N6PEQ7_9ASTR|nr:hypothetical protein E3N88_10867 [Mikania micrantha]
MDWGDSSDSGEHLDRNPTLVQQTEQSVFSSHACGEELKIDFLLTELPMKAEDNNDEWVHKYEQDEGVVTGKIMPMAIARWCVFSSRARGEELKIDVLLTERRPRQREEEVNNRDNHILGDGVVVSVEFVCNQWDDYHETPPL